MCQPASQRQRALGDLLLNKCNDDYVVVVIVAPCELKARDGPVEQEGASERLDGEQKGQKERKREHEEASGEKIATVGASLRASR